MLHEGLGTFSDVCGSCRTVNPAYKCRDCVGMELFCSSCIVLNHSCTPCHRLKKLGLRLQLGHRAGETCSNPKKPYGNDFVLIDTHGIFSISINFCNLQQLLCMSWYPTMTTRLWTAVTFQSLEIFHLISLESKISTYEYYNALQHVVNNTGLSGIKTIKHAGRAYNPLGLSAMAEGEYAELCPTYSQPRKNLPKNFDRCPEEQQKKVSSDGNDPSFNKGWAYCMSLKTQYIRNIYHLKRIPYRNVDTKSSTGLVAMDIGTMDYAWHNMKLSMSIGDLQKGEQYINMDYFFFQMLRHFSPLPTLKVSYDIACQWNKRLWERMLTLPASLHISPTKMSITFLILKFHLLAYIKKCQMAYSFNFVCGVDQMDGEAPEWGWANINPIASSTKEMGPGAWHDTLDDFFGHVNWKKYVGMPKSMLKALKEAISRCTEYQVALSQLKKGLAQDHSEELVHWRVQVETWEKDPSNTNPYERGVESILLAAVRLKLAKEKAQNIHAHVFLETCSPSALLSTGLELKEQQCICNNLQRCIESWVTLQHLFTLALAPARAHVQQKTESIIQPENFPLLLPFQMQHSMLCDKKLCLIEWRLCFAQAHDALHSLRSNLHRNLRGQGTNIRAHNTLKLIDARINTTINKYHAAHKVLTSLSLLVKQDGWHMTLRPLELGDIQSMSDLLEGETEETRKLFAGSSDTDETGAIEDMHIKWCKARACTMRWREELELHLEEIRRVIMFMEWEADLWTRREKESYDAGNEECGL
ncbi:hypothetical protein HD554DRAFT_2205055 [Boletus coccyginus]|nr:hypothetical protein HD554DRAFT_2205055 [Boletus coccyginus]